MVAQAALLTNLPEEVIKARIKQFYVIIFFKMC